MRERRLSVLSHAIDVCGLIHPAILNRLRHQENHNANINDRRKGANGNTISLEDVIDMD
jgi:hypothetical protein